MKKEMNKIDIIDALNLMVKNGYLKLTPEGYQDSDRVTALLKKGKTRSQIANILEKEAKKAER